MLKADLTHFARAIVYGEEPLEQVKKEYFNYSADVAIEVYRNNYRGNLHDALSGAYPVIKKLVGDEFFRYLAKIFIERHPSSSANLHHYGVELPVFLQTFDPARELVYLSDVANLEWACHVAYFVDDANTLDLIELSKIAPDQYSELVLCTNQSCHVIRSRFPISAIWHANQPEASDEFNINLESGCCNALVYRKDDVVQVGELTEAEAQWLQLIQTKISLGDASARVLAEFSEFDLFRLLQELFLRNIFVSCTMRAAS